MEAARPRGEIADAMAELSAEYRPALADLRAVVAGLAAGDRERVPLCVRAVDRIADGAARAKLRALLTQCAATRNALLALEESGALAPALVAEVGALAAHVELYMDVYREVAATDAGPSTLVTLASWMDAPGRATARACGSSARSATSSWRSRASRATCPPRGSPGCGRSCSGSAIARSLGSRDYAARLSEADVIDLLFTPGSSTAPSITAGTVTLSTEPGRGTLLALELPFAPP